MGIYWILWGIGWLLVGITRIVLNAVKRGRFDDEYIEDKPAWYQIITITLMCICISIVGGITNAFLAGSFILKDCNIASNIMAAVIIDLIPAILIYLVGYLVLGIYKEERSWVRTIFILIYIVSIVLWTIPIHNYNSNIEYREETGISSTQEYDLYYFCNIPVQQVSGSVSGTAVLGTGSVSGKISTSEELPYWYDNGSGEGVYDSVSADDSKIIFIEDGETPFIRIITHYQKKIKVDNNVGKESVNQRNTWVTYEFHLPKGVMQYNID